ncbi:MAG: vWA domain-containing protein [Bacteroidales bacterium]
MKPILKTLIALVMLAALLGPVGIAFPVPVQAAAGADGPSCNQVEMIFLIDQSGSMGGDPANDPYDLRFEGPRYATEWMGNLFRVMQNIPGKKPTEFSVALIHFGSDVLPVDFSNDERSQEYWLTLTPKDEAVWTQMKALLKEKTGKNSLGPRKSLGDTNFLRPFVEAARLFSLRSDKRVAGCPKRVVVLLTDGEPDTADDRETHLEKVVKVAQANMPANQGYQIFVTGINDPKNPGYWNTVSKYWAKISTPDEKNNLPGHVLVTQMDALSTRLQKIVDSYMDPPPPFSRVIPPYLQEVDIVLNKRRPDWHLVVADSQGPLNASRTGVQVTGQDGMIETMRIAKPQPGRWQIDTTSGVMDVQVLKYQIPASVRLLSPTGGEAFQYSETQIRFQLVDKDGNPLPVYNEELYRIQVPEALINDGVRDWPVSMQVDPDPKNPNTFLARFIPWEKGPHTLKVKAISQDIDRNVINVVDGVVGTFLVDPVEFRRVETPQAGCPVQVGDEMKLQYQAYVAGSSRTVNAALPLRLDATLDGCSAQKPETRGNEIRFTCSQAGKSNLLVSGTLQSATTEKTGSVSRKVIQEQIPVQTVEVAQVTPRLKVLDPSPAPWWSLLAPQPTPPQRLGNGPCAFCAGFLPVEMEIGFDASGKEKAPAEFLARGADRPLEIAVSRKDGSPLTGAGVDLAPAEEPGHFHLTLTGLPLGTYQVRAKLAKETALQCGYTFKEDAIELELVNNWLNLACMIFLGVILLMILICIIIWWCLTRNKFAEGWVIGVARGSNSWYQYLGGRNYWRFSLTESAQAQLLVKTLAVSSTQKRCGRDPYPANQAGVTVTMVSQGEKPRVEPVRVTKNGEPGTVGPEGIRVGIFDSIRAWEQWKSGHVS